MSAKRDMAKQAGGFEDSRPKHEKGVIRTPNGNGTPVFCVSCGVFGGYAYIDTTYIVYVCDECEAKHGGLDLPVADEDVVRGRKEDS